jgi:hypothetical protein
MENLDNLFSGQPRRGRPSLSAEEKLARAEAKLRSERILSHPDLAPIRKAGDQVRQALTILADSDSRIRDLEAEIARIDAIVAAKDSILATQRKLQNALSVDMDKGSESEVVAKILDRWID